MVRRDPAEHRGARCWSTSGCGCTGSILLVAALSFVGLGLQPPAADWGLMIGENRVGLTVQPWPVIVPAVAIGLLTIGINLDHRRRTAGRTAASYDKQTRSTCSEARRARRRGAPRRRAVELGVDIVADVSLRGRRRRRPSASSASRAAARPRSRWRSWASPARERAIAGGLGRRRRHRPPLARRCRACARSAGELISYVPQNPARALSPGHARRTAARGDASSSSHRLPSGEAAARGWPGRARSCRTAARCSARYPHQLSGGQQQRVAIAMALVCEPRGDRDGRADDRPRRAHAGPAARRDPRASRRAADVSIVYVSHDLGVVRNLVDRVAVMYGGRIVETGAGRRALPRPGSSVHASAARGDPARPAPTPARLRGIPGSAVEPWDRPPGCPFAPRCDYPHRAVRHGDAAGRARWAIGRHAVRCWVWGELGDAATLGSARRRPRQVHGALAAADGPRRCSIVRDLHAGYRGRRPSPSACRERERRRRRGVSFDVRAGAVPRRRRRERKRQDDPRALPRRAARAALRRDAVRRASRSARSRAIARPRSGGASRSSSRTRTARSTRA